MNIWDIDGRRPTRDVWPPPDCGDDDDTPDNEELTGCIAAGERGGGGTVVGAGYCYTLPEGWIDVADPEADVPRVTRDLADSIATVGRDSKLDARMSVLTRPTRATTMLARFARKSRRAIMKPGTEPAGVTFVRLSSQSAAELGDVEAMRVDREGIFAGPLGAETYSQRQLLVLHEDAASVATFGSYAEGPDEESTAFEQIIDSWRWTASP